MKYLAIVAMVLFSLPALGQSLEEIDAAMTLCRPHGTISRATNFVQKWDAGWEQCAKIEKAWRDSEGDRVRQKKEDADKAHIQSLTKKLESK